MSKGTEAFAADEDAWERIIRSALDRVESDPAPTEREKGPAAAFEHAEAARQQRMTHEDWRYWTGMSR